MVKHRFYSCYSQHRADTYAQGKPGLEQSFKRGIDLASIAMVLNSRRREALRPEERAVLTAAFTGGLLTAARLRSWGLSVCPMSVALEAGRAETPDSGRKTAATARHSSSGERADAE